MRAVFYKPRNKFRVIIPPAITGTGKRQCRFFDTKQEAEAEIRKIHQHGHGKPKVTDTEHAALLLAKQTGMSESQILDAVRHYQKTVLATTQRGATVGDAALAFVRYHEEIASNVRTVSKHRQMRARLMEEFGDMLIVELTQEKLNSLLLKRWKRPGTRRARYADTKALVNWCLRNGYLSVDPMLNMKPVGKWGANNTPLDIETFGRILNACFSNNRFRRLLPFYVLGGLCGMRRCEIISSYKTDPVIQWEDIRFDKNWIFVRREVAKQTGATDQARYIPLEPVAVAWLKLIAKSSGPVMEISQSTVQRLNFELWDQLKVTLPDNGLRNGYATWSATFRPIGELAAAMGDLEQTVKRFYIERREPGSGRAWFEIFPGDSPGKIIPIKAA